MKLKDFPNTTMGAGGLCYFDPLTSPVRISGLPFLGTNGNWNRLDNRLTDKYPDGLKMLTECTSGATVSFKTDSKRIAVNVDGIINHKGALPHMPDNASAGIDFYVGTGKDKRFHNVFSAVPDEIGHWKWERPIEADGMCEITMYMPLYAGIKKLLVGLEPDATVEDSTPPANGKVLFYGSSITQGACASRPGMSYCNILGRMFDFEVIDLGFSGCARGESVIAEEIASIDLSAFVYDYDHNAPTAEELEATHKSFFEIVRRAHPDIPIIIISKADLLFGKEETLRRRDIIKKTYLDAVSAGDLNVRFVDGTTIYGDDAENCTVDGCHPNDIGFRHMVEAIAPVLAEFFK